MILFLLMLIGETLLSEGSININYFGWESKTTINEFNKTLYKFTYGSCLKLLPYPIAFLTIKNESLINVYHSNRNETIGNVVANCKYSKYNKFLFCDFVYLSNDCVRFEPLTHNVSSIFIQQN